MNYTKLIARILGSLLIAGTLYFVAKDELQPTQHKLFGVCCALLGYILILRDFQQETIEDLKDRVKDLEDKLKDKNLQ